MITREEILKGRDVLFPIDGIMEQNLGGLLRSMNLLRDIWGLPMIVTSGYRPKQLNCAVDGRPKSRHLTCEACDIADPDGSLGRWSVNHVEILEACGLWMENPEYTKGWVHYQIQPPKSGNRIFTP